MLLIIIIKILIMIIIILLIVEKKIVFNVLDHIVTNKIKNKTKFIGICYKTNSQ